jgi:ribosomal protein S18 acetylase RimI-like enzyme
MADTVQLRRAKPEDAEFAWNVYAETTKPQIAPKLKQGWKDDEQKRQFETWWRVENTMIGTLGDKKIAWVSFHEKGDHVDIEHGCVLPEFQRKGIFPQILQQLLDSWKGKVKSVELSVLKESPHRKLFEGFGFQPCGEDQLTVRMKRKHA